MADRDTLVPQIVRAVTKYAGWSIVRELPLRRRRIKKLAEGATSEVTDPGNLLTLADPIIADVISTVVSDSCVRTAGRIKQGLREMRRGKEPQPNLELVNTLIRPTSASDISLSKLAALPRCSVSAHEVRTALESHSISAIIQQLVCAQLVKPGPAVRETLKLSFQLALKESISRQLPDEDAFNEFSARLFDVLAENAENAVAQSNRADREPISEMFAQLTLIRAAVDNIHPLLNSLNQRQVLNTLESADSWKHKYKKQCSKFHGVITPPDFKERNTVPLDQIYVPARIALADDGAIRRNHRSLYDIIDDIDRDVLVGDPGGGKSTTTHAIAYRLAETENALLPFVVVLRDYAAHSDTLSIVEYIERQLRTLYQADPPQGLIETYLDAGEALVIFDGLDELIDSSRRIAISQRIELFSSRFPMSKLYVTSRKVGYKEARLDPQVFRVLELSGYEKNEVEEYVSKWFSIQHNSENVDTSALQEAFIRESASIPDLRRNPLLLALLCIIYRGQGYLPKNRIGIYEECSKLLFETWDKSRGIVFDFTFESYISDALKHLAYWMWSDKNSDDGVTETLLVRELTKFFSGRAYESEDAARKAATEFVTFCSGRAWVLSEAGVTPEHESLFKFTHRTFMEFFAATQVNRLHPEPKSLARFLLPHISRNEWDTVGQLCVHLMHRSADQGAEVVINQMLKSSESRSVVYRENVLDFIARCLVDLHVGPKLVKKVLRASIDNLVSVHSGNKPKVKDSMWEAASWRRLCQLEASSELVRDELAVILNEMLTATDPAELRVAVLILSELKYTAVHPGLRPGVDTVHWHKFAKGIFRQHRDVIFSLEGFAEYAKLSAYLDGALDASEFLGLLHSEGDLPLDFAVRSYRLLTDSNAEFRMTLAASLIHIASFRINGTMPTVIAGVSYGWSKLVDEVYEQLRLAEAPLARRKLYDVKSFQPWRSTIDELTTDPSDEKADLWAFLALLTALHVELDSPVKEKVALTQRGTEGSLFRTISEARASRHDLARELMEVIQASSPSVAVMLSQWAAGDLNFALEEESSVVDPPSALQ